MRNLILIAGVVAMSFTNSVTATTIGDTVIKYPQSTEEIMSPMSISSTQEKSIDEVIADDNRIIESTQTSEPKHLCLDLVEYTIAEDHKIIESEFEDVVYPLDFEKINRKLFPKVNDKQRMLGEL